MKEHCRHPGYSHSKSEKCVFVSAGFRRSFRLSRKDRKTNKFMYECKKSDQYDTADVPTFEEVALYQRQPNEKYRLIILVGKYRLFVKLHPTIFFFFLQADCSELLL